MAFAALTFKIGMREAWDLTPKEYLSLWDVYAEVKGIKKKDPFTRDDLKRLERIIGRRRRNKDKD